MASNENVWRSENFLVIRRGAELPDRCIKTNQPTYDSWLKQTFAWHQPQVYLVLFVGWFGFFLLLSLFQATSQISFASLLGSMLGNLLVTFLPALLIYGVVALFVQKNATIYLGVSKSVLRKRRKGIILCWLFGLSMPILAFCLVPLLSQTKTLNPESNLFLIGMLGVFLPIVLMLGAVVVGLRIAKLVRPDYIDDEYIWLEGITQEYLDMLPEWSPEQESEEMPI
jgi:hypothetical protein